MRYLLAMILSFVSGAFQVVTASRLADDGSVTAWVGVAVIGCIIFYQTIIMALVSVQEERSMQVEEERA